MVWMVSEPHGDPVEGASPIAEPTLTFPQKWLWVFQLGKYL